MTCRWLPLALLFIATGILFLLTGCTGGRAVEAYPTATSGDARRGKTAIEQYRCGACHEIPGIPGARGLVGPSLAKFAYRSFVGGEVPNIPENLVKWIMSPQSIEPATAMPTLGVNEQQARDTAAYLYTLR
jgi:cytochrome c2